MGRPAGTTVAIRSRPDGVVGYTFPATVVRDDPNLVVLFQAAGAVCKRRSGDRGGPRGRNLVAWDGSHVDVKSERATIHAWVPGDAFWVIRGWDGADYRGWYLNLADPWRRTSIGFDTHDRILDIEVADDRSSWRWKDDDELRWAVETGRVTSTAADEIRHDGERAIARLQAGSTPFDLDWSELAPDPTWGLPVLPEGWAGPDA